MISTCTPLSGVRFIAGVFIGKGLKQEVQDDYARTDESVSRA